MLPAATAVLVGLGLALIVLLADLTRLNAQLERRQSPPGTGDGSYPVYLALLSLSLIGVGLLVAVATAYLRQPGHRPVRPAIVAIFAASGLCCGLPAALLGIDPLARHSATPTRPDLVSALAQLHSPTAPTWIRIATPAAGILILGGSIGAIAALLRPRTPRDPSTAP
jgi:hypothetical protein